MNTPTSQRNREFIKRCQKRFAELSSAGRTPSVYAVVLDVLGQPAPSYYVDFYYANSVLRSMLKSPEKKQDIKYYCSRMWTDMLRDYRQLSERFPARTFHEIVLDLVVGTYGHPRFYISPRRAVEIVRPFLETA